MRATPVFLALLLMVLIISGCGRDDTTAAIGPAPDLIAVNAFYYYDDVDAAWLFYRDTLGFETVVDYGFAKILRLAETSYITLVQADEGMHSADEPKTVTLTLITDTLTPWQEYLQSAGVPLDHVALNRFVVVDPEGYALRFIRYNPHPNHETFNPAFAESVPVTARVADDLSVRATAYSAYFDDATNVADFYSGLFGRTPGGELLGESLLQIAGSGFLSLVDGGDDLHEPTAEAGVTYSFFTTDVDAWFKRASGWPGFELRTPEVLDEGGLVRVFVGYDPTGIFLEWDTFRSVEENATLNRHLAAQPEQ